MSGGHVEPRKRIVGRFDRVFLAINDFQEAENQQTNVKEK